VRDVPFDDTWASLPEISFLSPRGLFTCDFGKGFIGSLKPQLTSFSS